jgi:para-nitrobenzyl esterase
MVYIHGGGYATGSGSSPLTDGAVLAARHDVVVITVNHRLNAFGYLYLEQIAPGFRPDGGNAGQWDLVLALQWIAAHASRLGGDPRRVMLFGQSGGGAKIATLMATPAASGLFSAVATMSGQQVTASGPLNASRRANALMDRLGISATSPGDLITIPAPRIVEALAADDPVNPQMRIYFGPVLDQRMLTRHPFWPDAPAVSRHIPMLLGNVRDETRNLIGRSEPAAFNLGWDQLPSWLARHMRTDIDPRHVIATYRAAYPQITAPDLFFAATTAARSWRGQVEEADMRARQQAPTWVYRFDLPATGEDSRYGAFHTIDIAHAFGTLAAPESSTGTGPDAQRVSSALMGALAGLARSGSPQHRGLPPWPQYRLPDRQTLLLYRTIRVARDPRGVERELFGTVPFIQWGS